jgi:hypothetical protein
MLKTLIRIECVDGYFLTEHRVKTGLMTEKKDRPSSCICKKSR